MKTLFFLFFLVLSQNSFALIEVDLHREVSVDLIDFRGDSIYFMDRPFTGTIYDEDDLGNIIYQREVYDGTYQLQVVGISAFKGQYGFLTLEPELIFRGSPFTGIVIKKHPNGNTYWENKWVNGKKEGTWNSWYPSGMRNGTETYKSGIAHGIRTEWFESGKQKTQRFYYENKVCSVTKRWNAEGVLFELGVHDYKNELGLQIGTVQFDTPSIGMETKGFSKLADGIRIQITEGTELEEVNALYQLGKFKVSEDKSAIVFGIKHMYGWMMYFYRIYDLNTSKFIGDFEMLSAQDGDAGELIQMKSWLLDINQDGIPEILSRNGGTYLDPSAPEEDRKSHNLPIDVTSYNASTMKYEPFEIDESQRKILEEKFILSY